MPNDVQIQMSEGIEVIDEAIDYLREMEPLPALEWDSCLAKSAQSHVDDIGPKGLLQYHSSDDTQPQERIEKFGNYVNSLGENIDFGPNDAQGVIISLTIDDGEEGRPHRENLFSDEYRKIGIACGIHKTEYEMCVMDFAYDFYPKNSNQAKENEYENEANLGNIIENTGNKNENKNLSMLNEPVVNLNLGDTIEGVNNRTQLYNNNMNRYDMPGNNRAPNNGVNNYGNPSTNLNQSPVVKLSLDNDNMKNNLKELNEKYGVQDLQVENQRENKEIKTPMNGADIDQFEEIRIQINNAQKERKVVKKVVCVTTKITTVYEDGSTKVSQEVRNHTFNS